MKNKRDHVELSKIIKHYIIRMWKPAGFHILAYFKQIKYVITTLQRYNVTTTSLKTKIAEVGQ